MTISFDDREKTARLRLIRADGIGPITFRHLIDRYGSAAEALDHIDDLAAKGGRKKPVVVPSARALQKEVAAVKAMGGDFLFWGGDGYPARLAAIDDAPPVIQVMGHANLMDKNCIGIVGARNASASGLKLTAQIAAALSEAGIVIVSGLARGIDGAAHRAALPGGTIACMAGGLDISYPRDHSELQADIGRSGLLVTEMPLGTRPKAQHFPRRNRLISGLSLGIAVIEAAARSGSLITARMALEQGREVFAVPGSPLDPRSAGANALIRDGAQLTESADDILTAVQMLRDRKIQDDDRVAPSAAPPAPPRQIDAALVDRLRSLLSPTPTDIDTLIRAADAPAGDVQAAILALELAGFAVRLPGGRIASN